MLLKDYARSPFREFESYVRIVVRLDEEDIQLISKQNTSNFVTSELSPGIHTISDISEVLYTLCDDEGTLKIEKDDTSMKTKLTFTRFGGTFGTLPFFEQFFLNALLGFTPHWVYKRTNAIHADSPGVYTSEKIL